MITIKLIDARRGLYLKCRELFGDEKIAENIYNYLCEGIEECEECEPERKTGKWIYKKDLKQFFCDQCGEPSLTEDDCYIYGMDLSNFCPNCGSQMMRGEE